MRRQFRRLTLAWRATRGGRILRVPGILPAILAWALFQPLLAADHPTLVSAESTDCVICHEELTEGRTTVHAPAADDCSTCHEVTVGETGTEVDLVDGEPALCVMCHDGLAKAVEGELAAPHYPVTDSCLDCHDPHGADARSLLVSEIPGLCAACHEIEQDPQNHGGQLTETTDCTKCHLPHGSENAKLLTGARSHAPFAEGSCAGCHRAPFGDRVRLRSRGERLCEACHGDVGEVAEGGTRHAALRGSKGRAGCLSCHDPHLSDVAGLLQRPGQELCAECHPEVVSAAGAATGHAPAAEDCLTCHRPHASADPHLLTAGAGELCGMCHDPGDQELAATHLGAAPAGLDCVACHTPHGSGHDKLLAANLHAPVQDGCDTCHEGRYDALVEDGESSLCLVCHEELGERAAQAAFPHAAMELARCTDCHNPHASAQEYLVKGRGAGVCADCHEDQAAGRDEVAHGVIDLIGCNACHEPHGSEGELLLRESGSQLCLACHDPRRVNLEEDGSTARLLGRFSISAQEIEPMTTLRLSEDGLHGHPLRNHRVLGKPTEDELKRTDSEFRDEMTCLTCHDPHKGRSEKLFRWNAASVMEVCLNCHTK